MFHQVNLPEANACSLSFTVGTVQTVSCTNLTSNVANPVVGQSVTGTCKGTFSSSVTSPVARFGVNLNGAPLGLSDAIPLSPGGASYTVTVPQAGNYVVQCQICTDSTFSNCTTMENVSTSASCRLSFTVGSTSTATAHRCDKHVNSSSVNVNGYCYLDKYIECNSNSYSSPVPQCNNSCTNNADCPSGLMCRISSGTTGSCRNTQCLSETDCTCCSNINCNISSTSTCFYKSTNTSRL